MQLVLIRVLPGSGKSTMAKALHGAGFEWFEADTYHLNDEGYYCYDPANVKAAHEWCQREAIWRVKKMDELDALTITFRRLLA